MGFWADPVGLVLRSYVLPMAAKISAAAEQANDIKRKAGSDFAYITNL